MIPSVVGPALHASCGHCREECARPGIICLIPLPDELPGRRPCGYDVVTITNCNGAVTCVPKVLSFLALASLPSYRWCFHSRRAGIGLHVKCPRREGPVALLRRRHVLLMPFTLALARLSSAGRYCCAWWRQLLCCFCIVVYDVPVPLPTLH